MDLLTRLIINKLKNKSGGEPKLQEKEITITENGTQTVTPDEGKDGLSSVKITTNVSDDWYIDNATHLFYSGARFNLFDLFMSKLNNINKSDYMFSSCTALTEISLFDTSHVTNMAYMFAYCSNLTSVPLFITSNVTDMSYMFTNCSKITSIPQFDISNVTSLNGMFSGCTNLVNVPLLNTIKVNSMSNTFSNCSNLSNDSLNNIMAMCANSNIQTAYFKKLSSIGLSSAQATTCQGLSNYQAFLDAGWTTGY